MTEKTAKAEAEKIKQEFYEQIPQKVFGTSLNYNTLNEWCNKAAIIHVKGIIKDYQDTMKDNAFALDVASDAVLELRIEHYQPILTELEK